MGCEIKIYNFGEKSNDNKKKPIPLKDNFLFLRILILISLWSSD
jgi:hypothetical protein